MRRCAGWAARAPDRPCRAPAATRWPCGGVSLNHHALSDFRTAHGKWLDATLAAPVAALRHKGVVTLEPVAQDGMRVRACAGASSFRRAPSLHRCRETAVAQVAALEAELAADPGAGGRRHQAAQARAAAQREARVEAALAVLPEAQARLRRGPPCATAASTAGRTATTGGTSMRAYSRSGPTWSRGRSCRTTRSARTSPRWASCSTPRRACRTPIAAAPSWPSTEAGTAPRSTATRSSSCPSGTAAPTGRRRTWSPASSTPGAGGLA